MIHTTIRNTAAKRVAASIAPQNTPAKRSITLRAFTTLINPATDLVTLLRHITGPFIIKTFLSTLDLTNLRNAHTDILISNDDATDNGAITRDQHASLVNAQGAGFTAYDTAHIIKLNLPVHRHDTYLKIYNHMELGGTATFMTTITLELI